MALAITIKPQHLCNILNGKKLGEVRKNKALINAIKKEIAEKNKATIYCICSKSGKKLIRSDYGKFGILYELLTPKRDIIIYNSVGVNYEILNGKVVARFWCDKVESFEREYSSRYIDDYYGNNGERLSKQFYKKTCLTEDELFDYIGSGSGYAIHISKLEVFDKPKDISDLQFAKTYNFGDMHNCRVSLTKAPQNFCYVEDTL